MENFEQVNRLVVKDPILGNLVNVYAIKGPDGYYLIDCGVSTEDARKLIMDWLPGPLAGILITHGHPDHFGFARDLAVEKGIPVYVNSEELKYEIGSDCQEKDLIELMVRAGAPEGDLLKVIEFFKETEQLRLRHLAGLEAMEMLSGQKFGTEFGEMEVIHTPGHSSGHCCFYLGDSGILFSGDHILTDVLPYPALEKNIYGDRWKYFLEYLNSLKIIETLSINWVFPGHGAPFNNLPEAIGRIFSYHSLQKQAVLTALAEEPQTPYQIYQKLYNKTNSLDIMQGIAKAWGYLDLLETEEKVIHDQREQLIYYQCK